jgi:hypothetical protein
MFSNAVQRGERLTLRWRWKGLVSSHCVFWSPVGPSEEFWGDSQERGTCRVGRHAPPDMGLDGPVWVSSHPGLPLTISRDNEALPCPSCHITDSHTLAGAQGHGEAIRWCLHSHVSIRTEPPSSTSAAQHAGTTWMGEGNHGNPPVIAK